MVCYINFLSKINILVFICLNHFHFAHTEEYQCTEVYLAMEFRMSIELSFEMENLSRY